MRVLCINLPRSTERRERMRSELTKLGLEFQFVDAVDGRALDQNEKHRYYSKWRTLLRHGRPLVDGEIGCALSHLKAYRWLIDSKDENVFIVEDDVKFSSSASVCIIAAERLMKTLKGPVLIRLPGLTRDVPQVMSPSADWEEEYGPTGAYAYCLNRAAAELLLRVFNPIVCPIDSFAFLIRHYGLKVFTYKHKVVDVDMKIESTIGGARFPKINGFWMIAYKIWRLFGITSSCIIDKALLLTHKNDTI